MPQLDSSTGRWSGLELEIFHKRRTKVFFANGEIEILAITFFNEMNLLMHLVRVFRRFSTCLLNLCCEAGWMWQQTLWERFRRTLVCWVTTNISGCWWLARYKFFRLAVPVAFVFLSFNSIQHSKPGSQVYKMTEQEIFSMTQRWSLNRDNLIDHLLVGLSFNWLNFKAKRATKKLCFWNFNWDALISILHRYAFKIWYFW